MSESEPLPAEFNGERGTDGKFRPGNHAGKGNPNNRRAQQIRNALIRAVKPSDMAKAAKKLIEQAIDGDRQSFAELCDRTIGKAIPMDIEERIARLETLFEERNAKP